MDYREQCECGGSIEARERQRRRCAAHGQHLAQVPRLPWWPAQPRDGGDRARSDRPGALALELQPGIAAGRQPTDDEEGNDHGDWT